MTATPVQQEVASRLPTRRGIRTTAQSPDVQSRLQARRQQIGSLRRLLVLADLLSTVAVVGLALRLDSPVAGGMAVAVFLAVTAHVYAADSSRSLVTGTSVAKSALTLSAIACALVAVFAARSLGREILLASAAVSVVLVAVRVLIRTSPLATRYGIGTRHRLIVGDPRALESTAARRAPAVESGEVTLVVTRAESAAEGSTSTEEADEAVGGTPRDHGRRRSWHEDPSGPTGLVERVVRTALDSTAERVTVIPGDSWGQRQLRELSWLLEGTGIDMVISTNLDGIAPHRVDVVAQDGRLMIKVGSASPRGIQALLKASLDRVTAAVLLVLSAPVLAAVVAAVRLESTGPAVFRQTRVREGGGTFTMYKFRTMHVDAEKQLSGLQQLNMHGTDRPLFKMEDDPRITRVGHVLRKTSLDELPQLVNVLKGQMSLIGPRPALPLEVEMYDYVARRRLAVKPGMTGLWQVSGRSRLTWDESIGFDLDYVDNWSPGTDAAIAVRTFRAVMTKDGAF
jgi:exopolysaccharide biosynthesis polyprenyl glycosylphosphotransferase